MLISFDCRSKPFYYNISGLNFNLDEIKHGIMRGNKKSPHAYMRALGRQDDRSNIIKEVRLPGPNILPRLVGGPASELRVSGFP